MAPPESRPERRPALLLDRDGVVNEDTGYLHRIEACRFVAGIFELAEAFAGRGFAIVIATNQSGIGRGLYGEAEYEALMGWMRGEFARRGIAIDGIYHCPFHPTAGLGPYRRDHPWRKPNPGMFLQAASDLHLDLARSWCIGDKESDLAAGRAAGVGTLILYAEKGGALCREGDHWQAPSLPDIRELLLSGTAG